MHATACDHVLDVVQNAFEAGATDVRLEWTLRGTRHEVAVGDNGRGMEAEKRRQVLDPFANDAIKHPGRKVGLGLPFLKQAVEQCAGAFVLESEPGRGTTVRFSFDGRHVDAPPPGDVPGTLAALMAWPAPGEFTVRRDVNGRCYDVRRSELAAALGGLENAGALALAREFFASNEDEIGNEVQDG